MDVHVGSPLVQSEELVVTHLSAALSGLVTLEASDPDVRSMSPADEVEVSLSRAFNIIPIDIPSSSSAPILPALDLPLFLSNLQDVLDFVSAQLKSCGAPVPDQVSSLMQWNPLLLQKQIEDLKASYLDLARLCSDTEEKFTQSQADLSQTSAFLDSARALNSSRNAQLDSEKMAYEEEKRVLVASRDNLDRLYCDAST
eukprot:XP_008661852.1 uncharacterized protein LOC103640565 isoform X2 [Zea mays]